MEKTFNYATIKITQVRDVKKHKRSVEYKHVMFCAEIKQGINTAAFCRLTLKELFEEIKEELYI